MSGSPEGFLYTESRELISGLAAKVPWSWVGQGTLLGSWPYLAEVSRGEGLACISGWPTSPSYLKS